MRNTKMKIEFIIVALLVILIGVELYKKAECEPVGTSYVYDPSTGTLK